MFEISKSIFGPERRIRSINFELQKKKWFLRVGDDDYTDPDIYKCDFTLL